MKRRVALKNIGLATGYIMATPSIINLLQSCKTDTTIWQPAFFSSEQGIVLTNLVDVILPKTEKLPSATEVNVPLFIDRYINAVVSIDEHKLIKTAFDNSISALKKHANKSINRLSHEDYKAFLDKYMLFTNEKDQERELDIESEIPTKSEILNNIKWMTINAYLTTEEIGEQVLVYDPVPTKYFCGDLQDLTGGISFSPEF